MCGIAGWVAAPGQHVDPRRLRAMAACLHHRGPDGSGIEIVDNVGLAHTRLAIVDPSAAGAQPMTHPDGRWTLVYNGEIFNHLELREQLPPHPYRGHSDTETLLHGLHTWGVDTVRRCSGLFAFAALDRATGTLWLARDHFGIKPLYIARTAAGIAFSSEIAALLAGGVPRRPNVAGLRHALELGWTNGPETPLADVRRLTPGAMIAVDVRTLRSTELRWFDPIELVDADLSADLERAGPAIVDRVEAVLRASVKSRLMTDVPLGTMCSGGVDSSLITAFAREEMPSTRCVQRVRAGPAGARRGTVGRGRGRASRDRTADGLAFDRRLAFGPGRRGRPFRVPARPRGFRAVGPDRRARPIRRGQGAVEWRRRRRGLRRLPLAPPARLECLLRPPTAAAARPTFTRQRSPSDRTSA